MVGESGYQGETDTLDVEGESQRERENIHRTT